MRNRYFKSDPGTKKLLPVNVAY